MLLVRGLLAWLPLGRLLALRSEIVGRKWWVDEQTIFLRAQLVNGLTLQESQEILLHGRLRRLGPRPKNPVNLDFFDRYVQLCTFQGELSPLAPIFLPRAGLLDRALFLRRSTEYCLLADMGPLLLDKAQVLEGLASRDPEIIVRILSQPENQLLDPSDVTWTPALRTLVRRLLAGRDLRNFRGRQQFQLLLLAGYVGAENLAGRGQAYLQGQLLWACREQLPPQAWAERFLRDEPPELSRSLLARAGYQQPGISLEDRLETALTDIESQPLRGFDLTGADYSRIRVQISLKVVHPLLVQKAAELLTLLPARPAGASSQYRLAYLSLQILCAQPIDEVHLRNEPCLSELMLAVCHPQLSAMDVYRSSHGIQSSVHYDLQNFLKLSLGSDSYTPRIFRLLLRYGLLYRYLQLHPDFGQQTTWQAPLELLAPDPQSQPQKYGGEVSGLLILLARKYGRALPESTSLGCQSLTGLQMIKAAYGYSPAGYDYTLARAEAEQKRRRQLLDCLNESVCSSLDPSAGTSPSHDSLD